MFGKLKFWWYQLRPALVRDVHRLPEFGYANERFVAWHVKPDGFSPGETHDDQRFIVQRRKVPVLDWDAEDLFTRSSRREPTLRLDFDDEVFRFPIGFVSVEFYGIPTFRVHLLDELFAEDTRPRFGF